MNVAKFQNYVRIERKSRLKAQHLAHRDTGAFPLEGHVSGFVVDIPLLTLGTFLDKDFCPTVGKNQGAQYLN